MNKKIFIIAFVLIILGSVAAVGLKKAPQFYKSEAKLPEEFAAVREFVVNDSMAIIRRNGIWCSRDDDCYPVDNNRVEKLLSHLQEAALNSLSCKEAPLGSADIIFKASSDMALFYPHDEEAVRQVDIVQGKSCFSLAGNFDIPDQPYQWFMQPLFKFSDNDIEEIYGTDPAEFSFSNLIFYQATRNNDFDDWDKRTIKIITSGGIIIEMTVFARGHSYWASVILKETPMPTAEAAAYIKNNGFLFDGWYFELPQPEGNRLFNNDITRS